MFNPKEALERIRRSKNEKEQAKSLSEGVEPLFPSENNQTLETPGKSVEDRLKKLEIMVSNLTEELSSSNEVISKLKRQNSNLETQVLKLEYENSQLKTSHIYSGLLRNNSNQQIIKNERMPTEPEKQNQPKKKISNLSEYRSLAISHPPKQKQLEIMSPDVEVAIEQIKQESIESILKRKEYQFRARKAQKKQNGEKNKCLHELAEIEKNYRKTMKKPVLVIKLDDADFE